MGTNDDGTSPEPLAPPRLTGPPPAGDTPFLPPSYSGPYYNPSPGSFATSSDAGSEQVAAATGEPVADGTATVVPGPESHGRKRSRGKVAGGVVAVLALLGAGGFAVSRIVAGDDGGADNPTAVGNQFISALADEDVLGVVDLLLPGERETMRQPLIDLVDNLKRLEVADDTATLDKVGGLDISFADTTVEPEPTNVDDITNIHITTTGTVSVDGESVPIGRLLIDEAFSGERPDLDSEAQDSELDWRLATVERDGRWYLSLFYSVAEDARARDGRDIPATPVTARGADTPEGAVQAMLDAVSDLDVEAMISGLNPNEAEALQRYAPLFLDDANNAIGSADVEIKFSDVKYTVTGSGERRTVAVDALTMHAVTGQDDVTVDLSGGCAHMTINGDTIDSCTDKASIDSALESLGLSENAELQSLIKTVQDAFADLQPIGLTVQQVDGRWFLSPIGTYADGFLAVLTALDSNELTDIIDGVRKFAESDLFTTGIFGFDDESIGDGSTIGSAALDACFELSAYSDFSDCLASGLDEGSIDPSFVPPYYRFAECGVGEQYFDGDVYTMTDEEFTAFATSAAPCFQQFVDDGTIFQFELPYELSRPDCLEGRNWYNVSDQDYNDRVFECAT